MFRFMKMFALCFTMGKVHLGKGAGLDYCLSSAPFFWNVPLPYTWLVFVSSLGTIITFALWGTHAAICWFHFFFWIHCHFEHEPEIWIISLKNLQFGRSLGWALYHLMKQQLPLHCLSCCWAEWALPGLFHRTGSTWKDGPMHPFSVVLVPWEVSHEIQ
jgi:hypothetical protein